MIEFFSRPYFEIWLKRASPEIEKWFQKEIEYLKTNIKPDSKVLDIGCGFGRHIKIIANICEEVVGIDNNEDMVLKARDNLSKFKNVKIFLQDANKLNLDDNSFDYVICMTNTFGNFLDIKLDVLKEMKRICKNNGKIIISVYSENSFDIRKKDYESVSLHIVKVENGTIYTKEGLISEQFTKPQLEQLFNSVNLKVKVIDLTPISYLCESDKQIFYQ